MAAVIDREKLLTYLHKRAREAGVAASDKGGMLALYAAYEGLAERIKNGEFNKEDE